MERDNTNNLSQLIQKWGNAISIALYDPQVSHFKMDDDQGLIGYRNGPKCAVIMGDPVCSEQRRTKISLDFLHYCTLQNKKIIYAAISPQYLSCIKEQHPVCSLCIGHEVVLNPLINLLEKTGADARRLRNKYNQLVRDGIQIKEYTHEDPTLEATFQKLVTDWQEHRSGAQIFQQHIDLFKDRPNKRWFYAEDTRGTLALILLNRIQKGWVLNVNLVGAQAPAYLSEVMILEVLSALRSENCSHLTIGTVPGAKLDQIEGIGFLSQLMMKGIYAAAVKIFHLSHRERFWKKFSPQLIPMHVAFAGTKIHMLDIYNLMSAFNATI